MSKKPKTQQMMEVEEMMKQGMDGMNGSMPKPKNMPKKMPEPAQKSKGQGKRK